MARRYNRDFRTRLARPSRAANRVDVVPYHSADVDRCDHRDLRWSQECADGPLSVFWTVLRKPQERVAGLREGLNATVRIILFGFAMDVIYQVMVFKTFYPV